jgi:hypothetical protein
VLQQMLLDIGLKTSELPADLEPATIAALPGRGRALAELVSDISDEDLKFALSGTHAALDLINNGALDAGVSLLSPEPAVREDNKRYLAPLLAGTLPVPGGFSRPFAYVLSRGIPHEDLVANSAARFRRLQLASRCGYEDKHAYGMKPPEYAFQSAFTLAAALRKNLELVEPPVEDDPRGFREVELAKAEADAWVGPLEYRCLRNQNNSNSVQFYLENVSGNSIASALNVSESEFLSDPSKYLTALRTPSARAAECIAGLRSETCEATHPTAGWNWRFGTNSSGLFGESTAAWPALTVVLKGTPGRPGRVLAVCDLPDQRFYEGEPAGYKVEFDQISPLQDTLAQRLLGASHSPRWCNDLPDSSRPQSYCVEGIERDQFVPLANELTSSASGVEDAWKHYLGLAKEAATKADELGKDYLNQGYELDYRKEAAQEEVSKLCGTFVDAERVNVRDGVLEPKDAGSGLEMCLDEPAYDLLFFTNEKGAAAGRLDEPTLNALWNANCESDEEEKPSFCAEGRENFEAATMAFAQAPADEDTDKLCAGLVSAASSGFDANRQRAGAIVREHARADYVRPDAFVSALTALRYKLYPNGGTCQRV